MAQQGRRRVAVNRNQFNAACMLQLRNESAKWDDWWNGAQRTPTRRFTRGYALAKEHDNKGGFAARKGGEGWKEEKEKGGERWMMKRGERRELEAPID